MVSKVRNFWLCVFSGVVATTLIDTIHDTKSKPKFLFSLQIMRSIDTIHDTKSKPKFLLSLQIMRSIDTIHDTKSKPKFLLS